VAAALAPAVASTVTRVAGGGAVHEADTAEVGHHKYRRNSLLLLETTNEKGGPALDQTIRMVTWDGFPRVVWRQVGAELVIQALLDVIETAEDTGAHAVRVSGCHCCSGRRACLFTAMDIIIVIIITIIITMHSHDVQASLKANLSLAMRKQVTLDLREYGRESLLGPLLSEAQGPALVVWLPDVVITSEDAVRLSSPMAGRGLGRCLS
jgi:hypothetical protein